MNLELLIAPSGFGKTHFILEDIEKNRHENKNAASAIAKAENRATPQPRHHPRDCSAATVVIRLRISL